NSRCRRRRPRPARTEPWMADVGRSLQDHSSRGGRGSPGEDPSTCVSTRPPTGLDRTVVLPVGRLGTSQALPPPLTNLADQGNAKVADFTRAVPVNQFREIHQTPVLSIAT